MRKFSRNEKNFLEDNINSSFQKCPLGKKRQSLRHFFTQEKGTLLPEKGHLPKLGGPAPPGSYAPDHVAL